MYKFIIVKRDGIEQLHYAHVYRLAANSSSGLPFSFFLFYFSIYIYNMNYSCLFMCTMVAWWWHCIQFTIQFYCHFSGRGLLALLLCVCGRVCSLYRMERRQWDRVWTQKWGLPMIMNKINVWLQILWKYFFFLFLSHLKWHSHHYRTDLSNFMLGYKWPLFISFERK